MILENSTALEPGNYAVLLTDIKSNMKGGKLYGSKGEIVMIKSVASAPVMLVIGKREAFPVKQDLLLKTKKPIK